MLSIGTRFSSIGAFGHENSGDRLKNNSDIVSHAAFARIDDIKGDTPTITRVVATADLPKAGQPRAHSAIVDDIATIL